MFFTDQKELRRFLQLPIKTPSRDALNSWLASLDEMDKEKAAPQMVGDANVDGSFDPLAHLDESDPNYQTRTVI